MTRQVHATPAAVRDLDDHAVYLGSRNPRAEERFLDAAEKTFDLLAQSPEISPIYETENPRLAGLRVRTIRGFKNYVLFYRVTTDLIEIIRVIHGARDLSAILAEE
jgi:toxin ParE1/3/4